MTMAVKAMAPAVASFSSRGPQLISPNILKVYSFVTFLVFSFLLNYLCTDVCFCFDSM